jgi:hypothetical protein
MKQKILLLGVYASLSFFGYSQKNTSEIPFQNDAEKALWIENHPEEYRNQGGIISDPEFNSAEEKAKWLLSQKEEIKSETKPIEIEVIPEFSSQEEKDEYFQALKERREIDVIESDLDPTFPVFQSTGDSEKDNARYMAAKDEWIKNNPEKYNQLQNLKEEEKPTVE